jgi:murein DD-endopeptidase MepM/ murein hydrolase activator NlpD
VTIRLDRPAPQGGVDPRLSEAARALESMLVKQIITTSKAFGGGESAGNTIRSDLFATTLADAVAGSGGLGLADQITRSLTPGAGLAPVPVPGAMAHDPSGPGARLAGRPLGADQSEASGLDLPVQGRITSGFGVRHDPFTGVESSHPGLDVGAVEGTPIRASGAGVVKFAGPKGGYGNAVEIDHGNGVVTLYGHASELLVVPGDSVESGQAIARVGSTGRATGPHLHFEVRVGGTPVDPRSALKKYGLRAEGSHGSGP